MIPGQPRVDEAALLKTLCSPVDRLDVVDAAIVTNNAHGAAGDIRVSGIGFARLAVHVAVDGQVRNLKVFQRSDGRGAVWLRRDGHTDGVIVLLDQIVADFQDTRPDKLERGDIHSHAHDFLAGLGRPTAEALGRVAAGLKRARSKIHPRVCGKIAHDFVESKSDERGG